MKRMPWLLLFVAVWALAAPDVEQHLLQQAHTWESRFRHDLARQALDRLLRLRPDHPRALAGQVRLAVKDRRLEQAQQWLQRMERTGVGGAWMAQARAWISLLRENRQPVQQARLLAKTGRLTQALQLYERMFADALPEPDYALEYYGWLADNDGDLSRIVQQLDGLQQRYPGYMGVRLEWIALKLRLNPRNPVLLDELYRLLENPRLERQVHAMIRRAIFRMDENGDSIPYYRRYLDMDPEDQGVQTLLARAEQVERARLARLANPAWQAGQRGLLQLEQGQLQPAEQSLRKAVAGFPEHEAFLGGLGQALMRQGRHLEAVPWFERALAQTRYDADKWQALLTAARFWGHLAAARQAKEQKAYDRLEHHLSRALEAEPGHPDALSLKAAALNQQGQTLAAERLYREILTRHPNHAATLRGLVELWLDQGQAGQARSALNQLTPEQRQALGDDLGRLQVAVYRAEAALFRQRGQYPEAAEKLRQATRYRPDEPWLLYDLARVLLQLGREAEARLLFEEALQRRPEDEELRYAHALLLDLLDDDRQALAQLEGIPESARTESMERNIQRLRRSVRGDGATGATSVAFTALPDEQAHHRSAEFNAAWDLIHREASPGKAYMHHLRLPLEYRFRARQHGQWFLRLEPVRIGAGRLPMNDAAEVATFGQGLFCLPACDARLARQQARGTALGLGYQGERWRADLGTTPLGFPVEDVVGGVRYDGSAGWLYWGVELARRPMTSTLLAFAGTRDPHTGRVWGGVRRTGVSVNLGHDTGGRWGFWSQLDLHALRGRNVADNRRARLMGGMYWRLIDREDLAFSLGSNGHLWWHEKTLDEFTWTQGGYYSPNRYRSLSLNADASGRLLARRLSWQVKGSWSRSWTYERTMPWFVDQPQLQQQARQIEPEPFFRGGPGGGPGYALYAALEYKVNRHLSLGVQAGVERSDFYEPNHIGIWLQYHFDGEPPPVHSPPDPLLPYTEF